MGVSTRPQAVVSQADAAQSITERKELAPLTTPGAIAVIKGVLPKGVEIERVFSEVLLAIHQNPKLAEATQASLVHAVAKAVGWGLTIGEKVHLVPFSVKRKKGNEDVWETHVQAIRDYKGDAELVINAGGAKFIDAFNFYENEVSSGRFKHEQGSNPSIRHSPMSPGARGRIAGSYAVAIVASNLPPKIFVMHREEIEELKSKSKQWNTKKQGGKDIVIPLEEVPWYGPKSCVKRVCKLLPTNPRMEKVLATIEAEEIPDADFEISTESGAGAMAAEPTANSNPPGEPKSDAVDDGLKF